MNRNELQPWICSVARRCAGPTSGRSMPASISPAAPMAHMARRCCDGNLNKRNYVNHPGRQWMQPPARRPDLQAAGCIEAGQRGSPRLSRPASPRPPTLHVPRPSIHPFASQHRLPTTHMSRLPQRTKDQRPTRDTTTHDRLSNDLCCLGSVSESRQVFFCIFRFYFDRPAEVIGGSLPQAPLPSRADC